MKSEPEVWDPFGWCPHGLVRAYCHVCTFAAEARKAEEARLERENEELEAENRRLASLLAANGVTYRGRMRRG